MLLLLLILCCLLPLTALAGTGEISGRAWLDSAGSGIYSPEEKPLAKVTVALCALDAAGKETKVAQQTTDAEGNYRFDGLDAGQYLLRAALPADHQFITPHDGSSVMLPAAGTESRTLPITLANGQTITNAHIGASKGSCYIRAILFEDANQNGGRSTAEAALRGVAVSLLYEAEGEWIEIAQEKTDGEGSATFWKLTPGTYRVAVTLPDPYIIGPLGEKINAWYNCIPPRDGSYGISDPQTVTRGNSLGMGVGAVSTGSLTGTLWDDTDLDGLRGAAEGGFAGAVVSLISEKAGVNRQITTDAGGEYRFDKLLAGEYTLAVSLPETAMFTLPGGDSLITEDSAFAAETAVTVADKQETRVQPIGVIPVTGLYVHVYNDLNANGLWDDGEPAFAGAGLEVLTEDAGDVRAAAVSDGNGIAAVPVLRGGDVDVRLALPVGQVFTVSGPQNDFTAPAATGDLTQPLHLPHGEETDLFAGVTLPASISGMLFDDADLSGVMGPAESGLGGFTVQALDMWDDVVAQTETDANGRYTLQNLLPAAHTVRFLLVDAYVFTALSETGAAVENRVLVQTPEYGLTEQVTLTPGQSLTGMDAGIFRSATVSGTVLLSTGIATLPVSGGMPEVRVTLLDAEGAPVSDTTTAVTDADGRFYLKGALPGTYMLEYALPEDAVFTEPYAGEEQATSPLFTVGAADDLTQDPLYAIYTGSLSGLLYRDSDLSAGYTPGETGLSGVMITLNNTDLDLVYETRSQDNGEYSLIGLRPGAYTISLTLPDGLCFAHDDASPIPAHAAAYGTAALSIAPAESLFGCNIAAAAPAALQGVVYFDLANDGLRDISDPGAEGVTLSLISMNGPQSYSLRTDGDGCFDLAAMVPGRYTLQATLDSDCVVADANGAELRQGYWISELTVQDGEDIMPEYGILRYARVAGHVWSLDGSLAGVEGRAVTLYQNGAALKTMQTDSRGAFAFGQLKPGEYSLGCDLPSADCKFARVQDTENRPSYILAVTDDGDTGEIISLSFSVAMGEDIADCDIGIGAMGALGDTAWLDLNANGLQDGGEPNIPGIHIALYQYGELAAETVTDAFGHYLITDLYPGAYTVRVTMPEELTATLHREDYPLAASVLTQTDGNTAEGEGIIVPSGSRSLNCDLGFVPRQEGVLPASLQESPATDWSFGGKRK